LINFNPIRPGVLLVAIALIASGCSTQRNTWLNRNFHQVNAWYNGLFNAQASFNQGMRVLSDEHIDNFDQPLSIFRYATATQRQQISSNMQTAYTKSSRVVARHSMFIRGVEYNRLIDNAYFLIAKSHFFRDNYIQALATFQYVTNSFPPPLAYESLVWQAKVASFMGNANEANRLLGLSFSAIEHAGLLQSSIGRFYHLVAADHFIRHNRIADALVNLQSAAELTRSRKERARLTFILAQHHYSLGNLAKAREHFEEVLDMSPGFHLGFHTKISLAFASIGEDGDPNIIYGRIQDMLRQRQYVLQRDRIYYALGVLALAKNDSTQAKEMFRQSVRFSSENEIRKGQAYYRLAQVYLSENDYINASNYYDSAMVFIPAESLGREQMLLVQSILKDLAQNIMVIQREDSLQRIAAMSEADRTIKLGEIAELIGERLQADARQITGDQRTPTIGRQPSPVAGTLGADAEWYFYNTTAMRQGRLEFARRFGNRPLEDMWRLSNQTIDEPIVAAQIGTEPDLQNEEAPTGELPSIENLIADLPLTPEMLTISKEKVADAYFAKGLIFKDRMQDSLKAVVAFRNMVSYDHSTDDTPTAYFYLIRLLEAQGQQTLANLYKTQLIQRFPESSFAKIFSQPEVLLRAQELRDQAQKKYENAYLAFTQQNFQQVVNDWHATESLEMDDNIRGQFDYIKSLALYRMGKTDEAMQMLEQIVANREGSSVHQVAGQLLEVLRREPTLAEIETPIGNQPEVFDEAISLFRFNPNQVHFFILAVSRGTTDFSTITQALERLNQDDFAARRLSISNVFLSQDTHLITVTSFPDKESAMSYYNAAKVAPNLRDLLSGEANAFVISIENYPVFYQEKNIAAYLQFFRAKYF